MCTIMSMHDINLAAHYSDKFLFLKDGCVEAYGGPEIIDADLVRKVYNIDTTVVMHKGVSFAILEHSAKYYHEDHDMQDHLLDANYESVG